ncbi:hypothetical protein DKP76_13030 [Falsochrobactrum shanghaiense]|uniref:Uncharacterized protein n=1 Tax=Falsochrobactrum shanghaiense TaxID=2201899 RepID=A0A316J706_9HYPH|nr:hypothetical protein DKP76_13030 [Falsochrobactrum shanghaiense]
MITKKAPEGACLSRMGAFAGWLHHPAHARSYHKNKSCSVHGRKTNHSRPCRQRINAHIAIFSFSQMP